MIDFIIISCHEETNRALLRQLPGARLVDDSTKGLRYYEGRIDGDGAEDRGPDFGLLVVSDFAQTGPAAVAARAWHNRPRAVLLVGIAVGVTSKVALGDVQVATQLIDFEIDKASGLGDKLSLSTVYPSSNRLLELSRELAVSSEQWLSSITVHRPHDGAPSVLSGPMLSPRTLHDESVLKRLQVSFGTLMSLEMDADGVIAAFASADERPEWLSVRGIACSLAPGHEDGWREYAADAAAAFVRSLIRFDVTRRKIEDCRAVLAALGLTADRHGERSALTLLALAQLRPGDKWSQARAEPVGVQFIMDFIRQHYQKNYAPNTRESIRKLSLQPFVEAGLLETNPDDPGRPRTSAKFNYQIRPRTLDLLRAYGSPAWEDQIRGYQQHQPMTSGKLANRFSRESSEIRLRGLGFANLRSLADTGVIELRPLVILVGRNGSGKSSFLRFFPLLRQSAAAHGGTPLSWYGHDVDFGQLSTVHRRGSDELRVSMEFAFTPSLGSPDEEIICYHVTLVSEGGRDVVKEYALEVSKHNAAFRFDKDGTVESVVVDGKATNQEGQVYVARRENGKLIPQLLDFDLPESSPWIVRAAPLILESLSRWLAEFTESIHYAAPVRAAPMRQYRRQGALFSQVDPSGANMALFLSALDLDAQVKFSQWVQEHLGVRVQLENEGQWSVSVKLEEKGRTFNLIDAGYGYSQLLPVLLQCWASGSGLSPAGSAPAPSFLAIEQPELHLHPAHQARLADVFVASLAAIQSGGNRLQLLIETHSDALINRLGELVEQKICNRQDVSVVLFEKDENSGDTKVTVSEFDDRGYLQNWPIGFFAP